MPGAGELREQVELRSFTTPTTSTYGEPRKTWATYATVWAKVEGLTARERLTAQQLNAPELLKITIYYRTDVKAQHRVKIGLKEYNLVAPPVNLNGANQWLELLCQETEPGT